MAPGTTPSLRPTSSALFLTTTLLTSLAAAVTLDCSHIRVDKQSFDLSALGGPKTVHHVLYERPSIRNTTFTVDVCSPLERADGSKADDECPSGTRVCGKEWLYHPPSSLAAEGYGEGEGLGFVAEETETGFLSKVIPIAGEYSATHGRSMDPKFTRLRDSASSADADDEGVRVELHGGKFPNEKSGTAQKAIIEFVCDREDWA